MEQSLGKEPVTPRTRAHASHANPKPSAATHGHQREFVVVVEDDADTRDGLRDALEGDGFEVFATGSGREVLDRLRTGPTPDAIVLDLYMPGLSGFEIYRALRDDPRLATIPIIVVTAASPTKRTGLDVSATIRKPVDLYEFLFVVRRAVGHDDPSESRAERSE